MSVKRISLSICAAVFAVMLSAPPSQALVIGAGQTATFDFDFGALPAATPQPLAFQFEITTASPTSLSDPAGQFFFQYLGIGFDTPFVFNYDGTGGYNPSPVILSISATDLVGSLSIGSLTESFELTGLSLGVTDNFGDPLVALTALELPASVDQIPEPGTLATLILGMILLAGTLGLQRNRANTHPAAARVIG